MASCVLYQNDDRTVTLIDIPGSIEFAQGFDNRKMLVSSEPPQQPYASVEPKSLKAIASIAEASVGDLLLSKRLKFALEEIRDTHSGPWCLPRITNEKDAGHGNKRRKLCEDTKAPGENLTGSLEIKDKESLLHLGDVLYTGYNVNPTEVLATFGTEKTVATLPPRTTFICSDVENSLSRSLLMHGPKFDLIVLDPPWPNRSARRRQAYGISYGTDDIRSLLASLPIPGCLQDDGLVAIWVTNKSAFHDMLLGDGGFFDQWGLELIEEWIWLKVTSAGEPISDIDSMWRKPYEVLLLAKFTRHSEESSVQRRVIVGVPDVHSRKPNLKFLLEGRLPPHYEALEIFARNLTSGWWAWGNEVLKFQTEEHWRIP